MKKSEKSILIVAFLIIPLPSPAQNKTPERLNLENCISMGLQNNPSLHSSQSFMEEKKTKVKEAFAGFYPRVNFSSNANTYSKNDGNQEYQNYNTGISTSLTIFDGYKTKAIYNAAKDNHQAHIYQHESNKQDLILNIIFTYYKTLQAERILKSAEESVKNSKLHMEFASAKYKAGVATLSDILKSEVELSTAELNKIKADNALLRSKGNLNLLIGLPSNQQVEIVDDLVGLEKTEVESYDSLLKKAIQSRSEIKKLKALMSAQQNYVRSAKGEFYPSLDANAVYFLDGGEISEMQQNWGLGISLTIPLFQGFSTKARVTGEEFAFKGIQKEYQALIQGIHQEVWTSYLAVNESSERIATTSKGLESAKENLSIAEGEYKEGVGSIIQLTDAQKTFVDAEQNYIQSLADYKISLAQLERTTGK